MKWFTWDNYKTNHFELFRKRLPRFMFVVTAFSRHWFIGRARRRRGRRRWFVLFTISLRLLGLGDFLLEITQVFYLWTFLLLWTWFKRSSLENLRIMVRKFCFLLFYLLSNFFDVYEIHLWNWFFFSGMLMVCYLWRIKLTASGRIQFDARFLHRWIYNKFLFVFLFFSFLTQQLNLKMINKKIRTVYK